MNQNPLKPSEQTEGSRADEDLRLLAHNARDFAMIITDHERRVVRWSAGAEQITGWSEQEVLGQSTDLIFTPEDRAAGAPEQEQETALRQGRAEDERWLLRKDGSRFWASGVKMPLYDEDTGELRGFGKVLRDRTPEKRQQDEQRALFEEALDAILIAGDDAALLDVNPAACLLMGMERENLLGRRVFDLFSPENQNEAEALWRRFLAQGQQAGTVRLIRPDGAPVEAEYRARANYVPGRHVSMLRDVTKRWRAEQALRASEQDLRGSEARLAAIFAQAAVGLAEIGLEGRFLAVNEELCRITGRSKEELLASSVPAITHDLDIPLSVDALKQAVATGGPVSLDKRCLRSDGTYVWTNSSLLLLQNEQGEGSAVLAVTVDMSERKRLEDELLQANETLETRVTERTQALKERTVQLEEALSSLAASLSERQDLLQRLVRAEEQERGRISRELHDQTGQHLTGLALGLEALEGTIHDFCPPHAGADAQFGRLRTVAQELAKDIHRIAVELRPTALDDLGLLPALRNYVDRWIESNGIPAEFDSFGIDGKENEDNGQNGVRLPEPVETTVYRVVQEALTNVARHGTDPATRATLVSVTLQRIDGRLQATVEDDGPGFDVESARRSGRLGLAGMAERAASCGGTLDIESAPGSGTTVILRIPVSMEQ